MVDGRIGIVRRNVERDNRMKVLYQAGMTLQEIGDQFGVSRERVRQILKRQGVDFRSGGAAKRAVINKAKRSIKSESRHRAKLIRAYGDGMIPALYKYMRSRHPGALEAYQSDKRNAKRFPGEYLTFIEWWELWHKHFHRRGLSANGYVMARKDPSGPFTPENCMVCKLHEVRAIQGALKNGDSPK